MSGKLVREVTGRVMERAVKGKKMVLVKFHAPWCSPCKTFAPTVERVAEELKGKVRVVSVNVEMNEALAKKYDVQGVPATILFKNGKPVSWLSGTATKRDLLKHLEEHLK